MPSGIPLADIGALQAGHLADLVVVDDDLTLQAVLRRGAWLIIQPLNP